MSGKAPPARPLRALDPQLRRDGPSHLGWELGRGRRRVIRRFRLHEVTERMAAGGEIDWAQVAAELGYTDQPHLIRDFGDLFGEPPTHYSRRYPHR